jgi:hypothetical protein
LGDKAIEEVEAKVDYLMRERAKEGASLGEEKGWEFVLTKV